MSTISRVFLLFCAFHSHHPMEERSKWNTWFVGRVHKVRHTDGHITSLQHLTYLTRIYVSMSQHSYSRCLWKFALRNTCIGKKIAWWAKHQHRKRWSWCFDEHADRGVDSRNGDGCARRPFFMLRYQRIRARRCFLTPKSQTYACRQINIICAALPQRTHIAIYVYSQLIDRNIINQSTT